MKELDLNSDKKTNLLLRRAIFSVLEALGQGHGHCGRPPGNHLWLFDVYISVVFMQHRRVLDWSILIFGVFSIEHLN